MKRVQSKTIIIHIDKVGNTSFAVLFYFDKMLIDKMMIDVIIYSNRCYILN